MSCHKNNRSRCEGARAKWNGFSGRAKQSHLSCAPSFITQLEDLVPGRSRKVRLQPVALENGLPKPEAAAALTFRDSPTEALFDNGLYCCSLSVCQLSHLIIKTVWYLYGCFHMVDQIILYGIM